MTEYRHPVLTRGHYQVVALTTGEIFDSNEVVGYLVVNASGARLRQELTLEDARAWMEELIQEESLQSVARPPRPRQRRMGR